jgi:peptidoglycan L-alanyl-D-glutamate endopeptidase CwlK
MASRSLYDLRPEFRTRVEMWLDRCKPAGLDVLIYGTLRSLEEQAMLYAQGRTRPGPGVTKSRPMGRKVTNARPGQSAHNFGLALDFVPLAQGKPQWSNDALYHAAINLAEACGLESLRHSKFPELAHLQMPGWRGFVPTN